MLKSVCRIWFVSYRVAFVMTLRILDSDVCVINMLFHLKKVKWSRYRPGVAQRVGRDVAVLFHDRGTRRGWVVSSTPRPHFTPGKEPVTILQEAGWAPGPVWTGGKSRPPRDSIPVILFNVKEKLRPFLSLTFTELKNDQLYKMKVSCIEFQPQ